jgi:hypothetical protein
MAKVEPRLVTADSRGRVTLTGHANERFLVEVQSDGSILLEPSPFDLSATAPKNLASKQEQDRTEQP